MGILSVKGGGASLNPADLENLGFVPPTGGYKTRVLYSGDLSKYSMLKFVGYQVGAFSGKIIEFWCPVGGTVILRNFFNNSTALDARRVISVTPTSVESVEYTNPANPSDSGTSILVSEIYGVR